MRGMKYLAFREQPPAVMAIPGVKKTRNGYTLIPWHAYDLAQRLSGGLGPVKRLDPTPIYTPLAHTRTPLEDHPFASEHTKRVATQVQREDLVPLIRNRGGILDWPCVSGDAVIPVNRAGKGFKIPLAELVKRFNGEGRWNPDIPTMVQTMDPEGTIRLGQLVAALPKGRHPTLVVTLESGEQVTATPDHVLPTPTGDRALADISVGDLLYAVAERTRSPRGKVREGTRQHYEVVTAIPLHPYASRWMRHRRNRPNPYLESRVPKHRIVYEAVHLNSMPVPEFVRRIKANELSGLTFVDPSVHEVHHIDGDSRNNDPSNLQLLRVGEHEAHHGATDGFRNVLAKAKPQRVIAVAPGPTQEVYDLVMAGPNHNFVANGIVVHNCGAGKTMLGLLFATAWEGRALVLSPSTTVTQWKDQAEGDGVRPGWLSPEVRVGYVTQGVPRVRRRRSVTYTITDEALARLRKYDGSEVLRLKPVWDETELDAAERGLLARAKAEKVVVEDWVVLDDLDHVLGAHETKEEAQTAAGSWEPGDYDVLVVGWGLLANETVLDALLAWAPEILIVDEAHRLKGDGSRWRKKVTRGEDGAVEESWERKKSAASNVALLCEKAVVVLEMTATPQADRPIDWWSILDSYGPHEFGSRHEFGVRYANGRLVNKAQGVDAMDYSGLSNVEELQARLRGIRISRTKAETHKGLPPLIRTFTTLDISQAGRVDFAAISRELQGGDLGGSKTAAEIAVASEQKVPWTIDRLKEYLREGLKVVVFTLLRVSCSRIANALREAMPKAMIFNGDGTTPIEERRQMVQQLIHSKEGGVLVGTIFAWGEAIDGMQHVDRAMCLTIPWTPRMIQQAEGRFERHGGTSSVIYEYVRMLGSADDRIWDVVGNKLRMVGEVRDDDEALALGKELRGDSPEAEAAAIASMIGILDDWESSRELRELEFESFQIG